ncbi:protein kinase [Streptomyces sp. NPDC058284]|uniref:protein kinase n=1 Tax=unclassified Streptomyces TaxID=2593676 RepID=UPI0036615455
MDDYAGRVLADRYRLPLPPSDEYEFAESRAFDTYSGQEVLVRQVPLPEIVEAEVVGEGGPAEAEPVVDDLPEGFVPRARTGGTGVRRAASRTTRRPTDPAVRRAIEAAQTAAQIPDHPRLDQVFDVFAEGGSLWIVSELVAARPLAALLADRPLSPYRAAEVAADVLAALRVLHAYGWVHRNITARTVLICDDGRVMLTGLAAGAAEEALCGYDPRPVEAGEAAGSAGSVGNVSGYGETGVAEASGAPGVPGASGVPGAAGVARASRVSGASGASGAPRASRASRAWGESRDDAGDMSLDPAPESAGRDARAGATGAVAAYRAGTRAAARVTGESEAAAGRIPDPYGVAETRPWHGAVPRGGVPAARSAYGHTYENEPTHRNEPTHENEHAHQDGPESQPGNGPESGPGNGRGAWDEGPAEGAVRGPTTALAAERARHARMVVVGAVTERWAPEQAGPVHENWQLAAPIGPATDLWALGALLFRAVQGHAPYPEDSTAELVQLVCAEPPAFAEECGPLRPVVESLLRQDPTDRLDFEELSGWLRSLVRSAPEPEAGAHVVPVPAYDAGRLPVVRRRGEVVRRRRGGVVAGAAGSGPGAHGRHKRGKARSGKGRGAKGAGGKGLLPPQAPRETGTVEEPRLSHEPELPREPRAPGRPRSLGKLLLIAILLGLAAAVVYAMVFMPKSGDHASGDRTGAAGEVSSAPDASNGTGTGPGGNEGSSKNKNKENDKENDKGKGKNGKNPSSQEPQTGAPELPRGFTLRKDPEGFHVAVASGWDRQPKNGRGQVRYTHGDFELLLVPGRDTTDGYGSDPMKYQREHERELQPFRDSSWATSSGMRRIDVGGRTMAEGQFTWQDGAGREVFVRNLAMAVGGKYHVVQVRGPEAERDEVTRLYEQASATYRVTD